jgi:hypothetical protein
MIYVSDAITALGISEWELRGEPTNESEFNSMFRKADGSGGWSSKTTDFGVTWSQITKKKKELEDAEPLKDLREVRNSILAETDWTQNRDVTLSDDAKWKTYRQALRDITKTYKTLDTVKWPTEPTS